MEKYKSVLSNATNGEQKNNSSNQNGNPLETIDCKILHSCINMIFILIYFLVSSEDFKAGMLKLCELLKIPTKFNDTTAILRVNLLEFCSNNEIFLFRLLVKL